MKPYSLEVCFSPALFEFYENKDAIIVVVDIFRATTSICTAFQNKVQSIIPVKTRREAMGYKQNGYLVAAERNGLKLDFANFGNSPFNFSQDLVENKEIVYTTTNGTKTIQIAAECKAVVLGAFSNFSVLSNWLQNQNSDIIILCSGWKSKYNIEDSLFAGALVEDIIKNRKYIAECDAAISSMYMWQMHKNDLKSLICKSAHYDRLKKNNLDDSVDYCLTFDTCNVIPKYTEGKLQNIYTNL